MEKQIEKAGHIEIHSGLNCIVLYSHGRERICVPEGYPGCTGNSILAQAIAQAYEWGREDGQCTYFDCAGQEEAPTGS